MKVPRLNPLRAPVLICYGCSNELRMKIERQNNGVCVQPIKYFCDTCEYGIETNLDHAPGVNVKYVPPPAPTVVSAPAALYDAGKSPAPKVESRLAETEKGKEDGKHVEGREGKESAKGAAGVNAD